MVIFNSLKSNGELKRSLGIRYKEGDFIGQKYKVYGVLGYGGFGIVYLVYQPETKSVYALKTFRDKYLKDAESRELFRREANVWVDLGRHPYLVRAFFVDKVVGRLYIAMEYIAPDRQGVNSLEGYLRRCPPDLLQCLRWSIQFCQGMEYAFLKGVCSHRDIKPANIMISQDKTIKISDFGLASVPSVSGAMESTPYGTPYYMSPEQFINFADCDEKSDIYSFGIVLYQMSTSGKLPFIASLRDNSNEEMRRFWRVMYKLHSKSPVPKLNLPLFPIIQRCLEKEPGNRYQTFKELREDLEPLLESQTDEIVEPPKITELEALELSNRGVSLIQLDRVDEGIATLEQAIALDSTMAWSYNNLGKAYYRKGWLDQAITKFWRALELDPNDAWIHSNLGLTYRGKGWLDQAIVELKRAIELDPNFAVTYCDLGVAYRDKGWLDKAITEFKQAIKLNPSLSIAYSNLALAYQDKGWLDQAIVELKRAIELDPNDSEPHCDLGAIYGKKGWTDHAIAELRYGITLDPNKVNKTSLAWAHSNLGHAYYSKGWLEQAITEFKQAIKLNPNLAVAYSGLGLAYGRKGWLDQAMTEFKHALELDSNDAWTHYNLAVTCYGSRRFDLAWKYVRFAEKLGMPTQKVIQLINLLRKLSS